MVRGDGGHDDGEIRFLTILTRVLDADVSLIIIELGDERVEVLEHLGIRVDDADELEIWVITDGPEPRPRVTTIYYPMPGYIKTDIFVFE